MTAKKKSLKFFHIVNSIITIGLLGISVISFFFINKDIVTYHEDNIQIILLFRILISVITFLFAIIFFICGILFPDEPYFLNSQTQNSINKFAKSTRNFVWVEALYLLAQGKYNANSLGKTITQTYVLSNLPPIKFIRKIWSWWIAFISLIFVYFFSYIALGVSYSDKHLIKNDLISPFIDNGLSSTYNTFVLLIIVGLILLTIFSILWRFTADRLRKNESYWQIEPIWFVLLSFLYIGVLVIISYYLKLTYLGMFGLVVITMPFITLIQIDYRTRGSKKNKKLLFVESDKKNTNLKFYYNFESDGNKEKELVDFEQFNKELKVLKSFKKGHEGQLEPSINVWIADGSLNGITMVSAICKKVKSSFNKIIYIFSIGVSQILEDGNRSNYYWSTRDYDELEMIFYEFIVNKRTPNLSNWKTSKRKNK